MNDPIQHFFHPLSEAEVREVYRRIFRDHPTEDIEWIYTNLADLVNRLQTFFSEKAKNGDKKALHSLLLTASSGTLKYEECLRERSDLVKGHAQSYEAIPVLVGRQSKLTKDLRELVRLSDVGGKVGIKTSGRVKGSLFSGVAEKLVRAVHHDRYRLELVMNGKAPKLPEFSNDKEVMEKWWPYIEKKFVESFGSDPESHPVFCSIRESASYEDLEGRELETRIRADIRKRLKQAFLKISGHRGDDGRFLG